MIRSSVGPTAACWAATAIRPEVTTVAADAAAAAKEIAAMAAGTAIKVCRNQVPMEIGTVGVKPVLTGHMVRTDMTVVTTCRSIAVLTVQIMTGCTGCCRIGQCVMGR